ncbi:hypothetical protein QLQ86_10260 [Halomonas sp. LR5S13]|uniref:hypothetical protein n=1 Tax=Halomonas rhizosphaerae TaxID=3043296 RepID=UPI0024A9ECC3|nr:hypothetical protein [Halomonas rhizosphaerae]MDI5921166.1 hypothetical protein [Halomonas rhizosphaerae]
MMEQHSFEPLIQLLSSLPGKVSISSGRFVTLPSEIGREELDRVLSLAGYHDSVHVSDDELVFSLASGKWDNLPPIYQDEEVFWKRHESTNQLPDEYFIVSIGASSADKEQHKFICSVDLVIKARALIKEIADHFVSSDNKALFFVSHEGRGVKKSISIILSSEEVSSLNPDEAAMGGINELSRLMLMDDVHQPERNEVLRRAITLVLDEPHKDFSDFLWVLQNISRLHEKYKEQYEIYFHNFSVSKLLNEIDQKSLEFNSKLMDFVSNSQNKALTIPGAIVAIGALIRTGGGWGIFLIMAGVFVVGKVVIMSNSMMMQTFDDLKWQIDKSFKKYEIIRESDEVVNMASECSQRLYDKISVAKANLKKVNLLARFTFWFGMIYTLLVFFDISLSPDSLIGDLPSTSQEGRFASLFEWFGETIIYVRSIFSL